MSRSNHTEAQMIGALKQLEAGRKGRVAQVFKAAGVCNKRGAPSFAFCAKGGYRGGLQ
jgi:hypothetical protein